MVQTPFKQQSAAIEWLVPRRRAALFMEKRLGKCLCGIEWAKARMARTVLVVAPGESHLGWGDQLEVERQVFYNLHEPHLARNFQSVYSDAAAGALGKHVFFIVSGRRLYTSKAHGDGRMVDLQPWADVPWDAIIFDESIMLQNPKSQISIIANALGYKCDNRLIMSGEPRPENVFQLFNQFKWCYGEFMGETNFWKWKMAHFDSVGYDWLPKKGHMQMIKDAAHKLSFTMTQKEAGIGKVRIHEKRFCSLPQKMRKLYDDCEEWFELPGETEDDAPVYHDLPITNRIILSQLAGGYLKGRKDLWSDHKAKLLHQILFKEMPKEAIVVTFRFNSEIKGVVNFLERMGVMSKVRIITGKIKRKKRDAICREFQRKQCRIILAQAKCIKYGLDLSRSNIMVRYSLPEDFDTISQASDRIISPAKQSPLNYVDLVCRDTKDEDIVEASSDKRVSARNFKDRMIKHKLARLKRRQERRAA